MKPNGNLRQPETAPATDLSPSRQAAVEQGLALYHQTAEHLEAARVEISNLKSEIAGYKVALEAHDSIRADCESRIQSMQIVRDEAVARRAQVETVLASMLALGRAHNIRNEPLIVASDEVAAD